MSNDIKRRDVENVTERQDLPAGSFSSWLRRTRRAQAKENGASVPCGECTACCRSSYFITIGPDETEVLARIPEELLSPAPGLPEGNVVLGYDENGHCPMLVDDNCSIYEHRPRTCRNYDCRIFAATGVAIEDDGKAPIARHALRWKFSYPDKRDRDRHSAVGAAATFLRKHAGSFPSGVPNDSTQLAILAIKVYEVFLKCDQALSKTGCVPSDVEVARAVIKANEQFESMRTSKGRSNEGGPATIATRRVT